MIDITNLPASIRERLETAQHPVPMQSANPAMLMAEAMRALASQNADLAALLLMAHVGCRELSEIKSHEETTVDIHERKWVGVTVSSVERTVTRSWTTTKSHRFS